MHLKTKKLNIVDVIVKCFFILLFYCAVFINNDSLYAQARSILTDADKSALENIIVEQYYVANATDYSDTTGGVLPKGSVTYRIYVDMKPGYTMQAVYGLPKHMLRIATTTEFFNNTDGGSQTGDLINVKKINDNTVALDSWIAMGGATKSHFGILKTEDKDGSIIKRNSLDKADGLKTGKVPPVTYFGLDLLFFDNAKHPSVFTTDNGSWAIFGGVKGPTDDNKVLIAQLTTNGKLSFELNLQIGTPTGASVQFVAKNPEGSEILFKGLTY